MDTKVEEPKALEELEELPFGIRITPSPGTPLILEEGSARDRLADLLASARLGEVEPAARAEADSAAEREVAPEADDAAESDGYDFEANVDRVLSELREGVLELAASYWDLGADADDHNAELRNAPRSRLLHAALNRVGALVTADRLHGVGSHTEGQPITRVNVPDEGPAVKEVGVETEKKADPAAGRMDGIDDRWLAGLLEPVRARMLQDPLVSSLGLMPDNTALVRLLLRRGAETLERCTDLRAELPPQWDVALVETEKLRAQVKELRNIRWKLDQDLSGCAEALEEAREQLSVEVAENKRLTAQLSAVVAAQPAGLVVPSPAFNSLPADAPVLERPLSELRRRELPGDVFLWEKDWSIPREETAVHEAYVKQGWDRCYLWADGEPDTQPFVLYACLLETDLEGRHYVDRSVEPLHGDLKKGNLGGFGEVHIFKQLEDAEQLPRLKARWARAAGLGGV